MPERKLPDGLTSESPPPGPAPETVNAKETGAAAPNPAHASGAPDRIGRFQIRRLLGEGAFARVYLGFDADLEREVAIKVPNVAELTPEFRDAFLRENRLAAIVHHPNICPVYEVGTDAGRPYIVMRVVPDTLAGLLKRLTGPMPPRNAVAIARKLALGLVAAHAQKVIHRDLKPANVLYDEANREVLLADFGLARLVDRATAASNGVPKGTPAYMSPEQARGQAATIGVHSDVYSLGIILYEMLTGRLPFSGSVWEVMRDHCETAPVPPSRVRPGLDVRLDAICLKALAKHPADRYHSAKDFATALADYLRGGKLVAEVEALPIAETLSGRTPGRPAPAPGVLELPADESPRAAPNLSEVQFTVYRPKAVRPGTWDDLLAFTHLAERRPDAPAADPDPIDRVRAEAEQILGRRAKEFRDTTADARQPVPTAGEITLIPHIPGIEFNPSHRTFRWVEDVHREEFRLRAGPELAGTVARGRLSAYIGVVLLADVDLAIRVDVAEVAARPGPASVEVATARPYRKIFASYSHQDADIVRQYEWFVETLGDRYLRDVRDLRAGEDWDGALLRLIEEADVFQLFWSSNSMSSPFVRREWEHALSLARPAFIRPTYWEEPLPGSPDDGLPPEPLRRLHFHRILRSGPPRGSESPAPMPPATKVLELPTEKPPPAPPRPAPPAPLRPSLPRAMPVPEPRRSGPPPLPQGTKSAKTLPPAPPPLPRRARARDYERRPAGGTPLATKLFFVGFGLLLICGAALGVGFSLGLFSGKKTEPTRATKLGDGTEGKAKPPEPIEAPAEPIDPVPKPEGPPKGKAPPMIDLPEKPGAPEKPAPKPPKPVGPTDAEIREQIEADYKRGQACMADKPPDFEKAREWLEKAATRGHAIAQNDLGSLWHNGEGGERDYAKAQMWFERAAAQENVTAKANLGLMYHYGRIGTKPDYAKALEYYEKAAAHENASAQYHLGVLYENGDGVSKNYDTARAWYVKAAKTSAPAKYRLGILYENGGFGLKKDVSRALEWYQKAATQGHEQAKKAAERLEKPK